MNGKDFMRHFVLVIALLMVFSVGAFADTTEEPVVEEPVTEEPVVEEPVEEEPAEEEPEVEAFVTVILNDTYEITVDGSGTVFDVVMVGEEVEDSASFEFDADGNVIEVLPPHPYEELLGTNVVAVIDTLNDPVVEDYEFVVTSESEEVVENITAMINGEVAVEEVPVEEVNPNADRFAMAEELGITPGKMNILERLAGDDEDFDYTTWAEASVKDIMAEMKQNRKQIKSFRGQDVESDEEGTEESAVETEEVEVEEVEIEEVEDEDEVEEKPVKKEKPAKSKGNSGKKKGKK